MTKVTNLQVLIQIFKNIVTFNRKLILRNNKKNKKGNIKSWNFGLKFFLKINKSRRKNKKGKTIQFHEKVQTSLAVRNFRMEIIQVKVKKK